MSTEQVLPIRKTLRIDPLQYAHQIEYILGKFLVDALPDEAFQATRSSVSNALPLIPKTGIDIIVATVDSLLDWHAAWNSICAPKHACWVKFIKPEFQDSKHISEITLKLDELLSDLFYDVEEFLGPDRWIVHFKRVTRAAIYIEKSIDYRIHQWMQEHPEDVKRASKKVK